MQYIWRLYFYANFHAYTIPCSKLNFKSPAKNGLSQGAVAGFCFDALRSRSNNV